MSLHLRQDIEKLKKMFLALSAMVEESVLESIRAFQTIDTERAQQVIDRDIEIDRMEIEVEECCLRILALHQPFAIDLRFIVAVLKINNGLERIGDLAANIAELTVSMSPLAHFDMPQDLEEMAARARAMLRTSLDALVNLDTSLARTVFAEDDLVDAYLLKIYHYMKQQIREKPENLKCTMYPLFVSRHLERIADLATNICEDLIYMVEGKIVRHGGQEIDAGSLNSRK